MAAVRDQNLNVLFDVAPSGMKTNKLQKNGGLGVRKALGDISNSRRPSSNIPPPKLNSKKAIPVAEDFVPLISKSSLGGNKTKVSTKGAGRKALGDLTNFQESKKVHDKKRSAVVEEPLLFDSDGAVRKALVITNFQELKKAHDKKPSAVVEEPLLFDSEGIGEHMLHDHEECTKTQHKAKAMDLEYFTKDYGIGYSIKSSPIWVRPSARMKPESSLIFSEMTEYVSQCNKYEVSAEKTLCASPVSLLRFQCDNDMVFSLELSP